MSVLSRVAIYSMSSTYQSVTFGETELDKPCCESPEQIICVDSSTTVTSDFFFLERYPVL